MNIEHAGSGCMNDEMIMRVMTRGELTWRWNGPQRRLNPASTTPVLTPSTPGFLLG